LHVGTRAATILSVLILFVCGTPARGGGVKTEKPAILDASVFASGGLLAGELACSGIFTDRIAGTIQSGLPAVVELLYRLVTKEDKTVSRGLHAYGLRYDVSENRYFVEGDDGTEQFATFEGMTGAIEHLHDIAIIPLARLDRGTAYAVQFRIAVHPLHGMEAQRITGWVSEQMRNDTGDSWRENVLNLNELIQHFFAPDADTANRSKWYETGFFHPDALPRRDAPGEQSRDTQEER
jgi:hypothetical protein